jgi:hypothetical protein
MATIASLLHPRRSRFDDPLRQTITGAEAVSKPM